MHTKNKIMERKVNMEFFQLQQIIQHKKTYEAKIFPWQILSKSYHRADKSSCYSWHSDTGKLGSIKEESLERAIVLCRCNLLHNNQSILIQKNWFWEDGFYWEGCCM